ncbi:hypothetical protein L198_02862 [Cryptococcus wingfieldii CBS 7118]|uniref:Uncharacterized protein n=1 Tax=Cryptococcus wingfieldii CBS 7118 TaxID=1295528 RepID=A0A1E3JI83_9TREE|nr:hypothetical protein L198_02862 [Cryptococcus wingfieldii CBS 7118]ODO00543.1 hypothetical protein L198_02862 [Cryptococcus wingfieldii CBS 7118]
MSLTYNDKTSRISITRKHNLPHIRYERNDVGPQVDAPIRELLTLPIIQLDGVTAIGSGLQRVLDSVAAMNVAVDEISVDATFGTNHRLGILLQSLSEAVKNAVSVEAQDVFKPNPKMLWDELYTLYSQTTGHRISQLYATLWSTRVSLGADPLPYLGAQRATMAQLRQSQKVEDQQVAYTMLRGLCSSATCQLQVLGSGELEMEGEGSRSRLGRPSPKPGHYEANGRCHFSPVRSFAASVRDHQNILHGSSDPLPDMDVKWILMAGLNSPFVTHAVKGALAQQCMKLETIALDDLIDLMSEKVETCAINLAAYPSCNLEDDFPYAKRDTISVDPLNRPVLALWALPTPTQHLPRNRGAQGHVLKSTAWRRRHIMLTKGHTRLAVIFLPLMWLTEREGAKLASEEPIVQEQVD